MMTLAKHPENIPTVGEKLHEYNILCHDILKILKEGISSRSEIDNIIDRLERVIKEDEQ